MARVRRTLGRLIKTSMMALGLIGAAVFGMYKMHVNIPGLDTAALYERIDVLAERAERLKQDAEHRYESTFGGKKHEEAAHAEAHKITVTRPLVRDVTVTQDYVCQIHSQRHIDVCTYQSGYLQVIAIKEGQSVKKGDIMFEVMPILFKAKLQTAQAERDYVRMEWVNTKRLFEKQGVSEQEVKLFEAKLMKAQAEVDLAQAELNLATIRAPFDGLVDRLHEMQGSLVKEGDMLTTLSDNGTMWVYFNVPEKRYLEYMADKGRDDPNIELVLANHEKFPKTGVIGAIESNFNNENGNLSFRADFENPDGLLRHGQTGTVLINRLLKNAIVIPQRATFENLAKRYVYIVGEDDIVHQREIEIEKEQEDIYILRSGLKPDDKIVLEGVRQVHDGQKVEGVYREPKDWIQDAKNKAE